LIVGSGKKDLVTVTVATGDGRKSIVATDRHPFWTAGDNRWTDAADLDRGDTLRTADGRTLAVADVNAWARSQTVYNLTVADLHTYYVIAGDTPVLVHNCGNRSHDKARGAAGVDEMTATLEGIVGKDNIWSESHGNGFVFETPYGRREVDIAVRTSDNNLRLLEVKTGRSNYTRSQRRKDEWIKENFGFETSVLRRDTPCPIC